jgi:hypothetical protein
MENKKVTITYKQIIAIIGAIITLESGELAIVNSFFKTDNGEIHIGFFIDEESKKLRFRHYDNEIYRPKFDPISNRYYIILDNGDRVFCY